MAIDVDKSIRIDLSQFKLHIRLTPSLELTLHFNTPSRRFYLSLIGFVVNEMKTLEKITSIPLWKHLELLTLLNETVGEAAGSSDKKDLLQRIYRKWKDALPDLENAPLFKILGRKKAYEEGMGKTYPFTEVEKDRWANLFEYRGSEENVRLRFSIDRLGVSLDDAVIVYEETQNSDAWERFISGLRKGESDNQETDTTPMAKDPDPLTPPLKRRKRTWPGRTVWLAAVVITGMVGAIATFMAWNYNRTSSSVSIASRGRMAYPIPDKPSIAVLPFVNLTGDPKDDYFCEGMTEEIITALSKIPELFVIAKQSTSIYKGKPVTIKKVSEELGIRYVLEGSIRKMDERLRVTAQLMDATTGHHLWAERYDRDLKDLFALQDELTMKVITALQVKLTVGELGNVWSRGTKNLDAYLKYLEAISHYVLQTKEGNILAQKLAAEVIALDPDYPRGYIVLAQTHLWDILLGITESPEKSLAKATELTKKAIVLDDSELSAHGLLGSCYLMARQHDQAVTQVERAVSLNPNQGDNLVRYAFVLLNAGRPQEAISAIQRARRLNPNIYLQAFYYLHLTAAYRLNGQSQEAIETAEEGLRHMPENLLIRLQLAAAYSMTGRNKEARAEVAEVLRINPKFSLEHYAKTLYYKDQADVDRTIDTLRKAGLK